MLLDCALVVCLMHLWSTRKPARLCDNLLLLHWIEGPILVTCSIVASRRRLTWSNEIVEQLELIASVHCISFFTLGALSSPRLLLALCLFDCIDVDRTRHQTFVVFLKESSGAVSRLVFTPDRLITTFLPLVEGLVILGDLRRTVPSIVSSTALKPVLQSHHPWLQPLHKYLILGCFFRHQLVPLDVLNQFWLIQRLWRVKVKSLSDYILVVVLSSNGIVLKAFV